MLPHNGTGILNSAINNLPFELHLPSYRYCGPGTKLQKRLKRGDPGINKLDQACKEHDIAYSKYKNLNERHKADQILENSAWERVKSQDSSIGEKTAAWFVTNAMKAKRKMGMGINNRKIRKTIAFSKGILHKLKQNKYEYHNDLKRLAKNVLKDARIAVKESGGRKNIRVPRIIPLPKTGGFLPILPLIFGGLSALGALTGGGAAVAKAVNDARIGKEKLQEAERHNQTMEAIAIGKGLYLKKHRSGYGLYLNKQKSKNC